MDTLINEASILDLTLLSPDCRRRLFYCSHDILSVHDVPAPRRLHAYLSQAVNAGLGRHWATLTPDQQLLFPKVNANEICRYLEQSPKTNLVSHLCS